MCHLFWPLEGSDEVAGSLRQKVFVSGSNKECNPPLLLGPLCVFSVCCVCACVCVCYEWSQQHWYIRWCWQQTQALSFTDFILFVMYQVLCTKHRVNIKAATWETFHGGGVTQPRSLPWPVVRVAECPVVALTRFHLQYTQNAGTHLLCTVRATIE